MNLYTQQVVGRIAEEGNHNFNQNILPNIESQFVAKGQHVSGRHAALLGKMVLENQGQITRQQSDALARGYEHGAHVFTQDQGRHLQAAPRGYGTYSSKRGIWRTLPSFRDRAKCSRIWALWQDNSMACARWASTRKGDG